MSRAEDLATFQMTNQCGFQQDALKLLVGRIDEEWRARLANDISENIITADRAQVDAVLGLLSETNIHAQTQCSPKARELFAQTYTRLQEYCVSLIFGTAKDYLTAKKICEAVQEQVGKNVINKCRDSLVRQARVARTALVTEDMSFEPSAHTFVDDILGSLDTDVEDDLPDADVVPIFEFLTTIYEVPRHAKEPQFAAIPDISRLGFIFQATADPAVARAASKFLLTSHILDTLLRSVSANAVWLGLSTHLDLHTTTALYFWSAVVETGYMQSNNGQAFINRPGYWLTLAQHLVSGSPERRKLCLYILERSVNAVGVDINFPGIFTFSIAERQQLLILWSRFITLVEIIAIDTSAHQTRAAIPDIQSLFQPSSSSVLTMPTLWPSSLLKMGLAASLSSVRVEIAKFLFGLSVSRLKVFESEYGVLTDTFLPFIAQASFFTVEKHKNGRDLCLHGNDVSEFIERVVLAFDKPVEFVESMLSNIVDGEKKAFEAYIVYVVRGISAAVKRRGDACFSGKTCKLLVRVCQDIKYESRVLQSCVVGYVINILKTVTGADAADVVGGILKCRVDCEADTDGIVEWASKLDRKDEVKEYIKQEIKKFVLLKDESLDVGKNGLPGYRALETKLSEMKALISVFLKTTGELDSLLAYLQSYLSGYDRTILVYGEFMKFHLEPKLKLEVDLAVGAYLALVATFINDHNLETLSSAFAGIPIVQPTHSFSESQAETLYRGLIAQFENDSYVGAVLGDFAVAVQFLERLSRLQPSPVLSWLPKLVGKFAAVLENAGSFDSWNVHENRDKFRLLEFLALEIFNVTRAGMATKKMPVDFSPLVKAIQNIIPNAHNFTLLSLYCEFLYDIVPNLSEEAFNRLQILDLLMQIWMYVADQNLSVARHSASTTLIELLFHPVVLNYSTGNPEKFEQLEEVAHALVPMGYARRRVLPIFSKCLHTFQHDHCDNFNKNTWIASVLVEIYCFQQNSANVFLIDDPVLGTTRADGIEITLAETGVRESSSRAHVALMLANLQGSNSSTFGEVALSAILASTPSLFTSTTGDAASEAHRVSLSELLLLIDRYIPAGVRPKLLDMIQETLKVEFSPAVRTAFEWILARSIYDRNSDIDDKHLWNPLSNSEDKPRYLASLLTVAVITSRTAFAHHNKERGIELLRKITPILLAFATTNRAVLRHTATSLLLGLKQHLTVPNVSQELEDTVNLLEAHVLSSPTFGNFSYGDSVLWSLFEDYNLVSICGGVAARSNEQASNCRRRLVYEDFMEAVIADKTRDIALVQVGQPLTISSTTDYQSKIASNGTAAMQAIALQTKSNTRVPTPRPVRTTKGQLIILASLVDKAPNLGGICRLADVLGAELLCIPDMNMVRNREFQAVAVTADKWMPMKEVVEGDIPSYLHDCKRNGYSIWGVEQTDGSVLLTNELKFPKKMVLVLGKEKEGIPPQLLRELDCAVEIKQVGVVRSMNIQTATAVIVNAYAVQHC
ncbi:uncharacterized protein V1513DRAFT_404803 [Lipomyces chichibuensis]|uniref:uncharacterized protein n=1 Tax=Lipomyces chichibuensis TaxID=1546026 RepID=UPI003343F1A8